MGKGVFLHRPDSIYDDLPDQHYQFPKQYLGRALQSLGDWIVYYEPVKGGGRGYYAIARVANIVPDPQAQGMHLALIEQGSYLPFEHNVPFRSRNEIVERGLLNEHGQISGRAQAAVRPITIADFDRILTLGLPEEDAPLPQVDEQPEPLSLVRDERAQFDHFERDRVTVLTSRPVRDRVFRSIIINAYDCRCALTGLGFVNGRGRAEVEAAHIRPVEHGGPDIISNGIALSGTVHWMFDRGLVSLTDDLEILVSRHVNDIDGAWSLMNRAKRARLPRPSSARPHPRSSMASRELFQTLKNE